MKKYYVYFINGKDTVYMAQDFKSHKVYSTLDLEKASSFSSKEIAEEFIELIKSKSVNTPNLHIIDLINL